VNLTDTFGLKTCQRGIRRFQGSEIFLRLKIEKQGFVFDGVLLIY
jgi:hypothetical protein